MKNLLDPGEREAMCARLRSLEEGRSPRWGRMNVNQMACHVGDPLRIALGDLLAADASTFLPRTVLRRLVLWGAPPPRGRIRTFAEIDQEAGRGTAPRSLAEDVAAFEVLLDRFVAHVGVGGALAANPIFGPLTARDWGRLLWTHTHHHLRQFGA